MSSRREPPAAVLGTAIATAAPLAQALLVSDLHVPATGGEAAGHLQAALAAAQRRGCPLLVLGDLFDSFVSPRQVRTGIWREVAAWFRASAARGAPVTVLHGNRDFLLGAEFAAAAAARVVAGGLRLELAGTDTLLLHGDELCQNDLPYQRAKRWLRSRPVHWLARALPLPLCLHLAERARRRSRQVVARGDQQRFLPTGAAVAAAFGTGVRQLVFGHIHCFAGGTAAVGGRYAVLPAFDQSAQGLLAADGQLRPVRCAGPGGDLVPVADPPPCPFA